MELQNNLDSIRKAGLQVAAVSYDPVKTLARFASDKGITFPLLSDPESKVIRAFGIYNQQAKGKRAEGIPHPGTFIIDEQGVIRAKLFHDGYRVRHKSADLIEAAKALR